VIFWSIAAVITGIIAAVFVAMKYSPKRRAARFEKNLAGIKKELGDIRFFTVGTVPADFERGIAAMKKARWIDAADFFKKGLGKTSGLQQAVRFNFIGICCYLGRRVNEAPGNFLKAARLAHESGDLEGEGAALGNLGLVYLACGEIDKAQEYHLEALEVDRETGNLQGVAGDLGRLGFIRQAKGELDAALEYHQEALKIDRETANQHGVANDLGRIGLAYQTRGELDKAQEYYKQALEVATDARYRQGMADILGNIGMVHKERGEHSEALRYLLTALRLFMETRAEAKVVNTLKNLHILYRQMGREDFTKGCKKHETDMSNLNRLIRLMEKLDREQARAGATS